MSRYIDPDKIRLISDFAYDDDFDILVPLPDVIKAVRMTPSEDVAPRAEVAREIFEEIQKSIVHNILHNENYSFEGVMDSITKDLDELKKKYTEGEG